MTPLRKVILFLGAVVLIAAMALTLPKIGIARQGFDCVGPATTCYWQNGTVTEGSPTAAAEAARDSMATTLLVAACSLAVLCVGWVLTGRPDPAANAPTDSPEGALR